jgi:hypothetical protein
VATIPVGLNGYHPVGPQEGMIRSEIDRILRDLKGLDVPDAQELEERTGAAQAYAGETPKHYVDYAEECCRTTANALRDVRGIQRRCWEVYQEQEPPNYAAKQDWQNRGVLPKPYAAVQFAVAMVQAAFSPQFLSIKQEPSNVVNVFWTKLMERQLDEQHANFIVRFTDASEMGFAVGQSMEMIPIWDPQKGSLTYSLVEPWKIDRDPNALNREPQSGMYWIHSEWNDYYVLREGEKQGRYINTAGLQNEGSRETSGSSNTLMHQSDQARLRNYTYQRNKYRSAILTREFWGTVLAPNGEMLLPNATYTTAAGIRLISLPEKTPYSTLRWPGIGFSPLPHLLRFEGRSLLQSVVSLWYLMCNLLSLHADYQNWIVNPMREINTQALIDNDDIDPYPGKVYQTKNTVSGQQAVRTVDQRFITGDILANEQYYDQVFQRGTMVNDVVQGLPGYRAEITARESAQNLAQSRTAFTKMGMNEDVGAVQAILAGMETLRLDATREVILQCFSMQELLEMFGDNGQGQPKIFNDDAPNGVELPPLQGTVHVSGLQTLLQEQDELKAIESLIVPMATHPVFGAYVRPYNIVKAVEARANLEDEKLIIDEKDAEELMKQQGQRAEENAQMQSELLKMQLAALQKKTELDERKVALEEQKAQLESQQGQYDVLKAAAETHQAELDAEVASQEAAVELARIDAELRQLAQQVRQEETRLALEQAQTDGQLVKIAAAIEAQREKLRLEADKVRIQAAMVGVEHTRIAAEQDTAYREQDMRAETERERIAAQRQIASQRPAPSGT